MRSFIVASTLLAVLTSGCGPGDSQRRSFGVGTELYSAQMRSQTDSQNRYFDLLCEQAGLVPRGSGCNTSGLNPGAWAQLVATGYNDIDARCDGYLAWLEAQRQNRLFANQTFSAATGLLGSLSAAEPTRALGAATLALGLGSNVYNAYSDSLMMGLESSTIKTIVMQRRTDFRRAFADARIQSRPDAVYALRNYLMICTPMTITMDVNVHSRDAIVGAQSRRAQDLEALRGAIGTGPRQPDQPAVASVRPPVPIDTQAQQAFDFPAGQNELRTLQGIFCIDSGLGNVGPRTRHNIELAKGSEQIAGVAQPDNPRITRPEFAELQGPTGRQCDTTLFRNVYENLAFGDNVAERQGFIDLLRRVLGDQRPPAGASFADDRTRQAIGAARELCGLDNSGQVRNAVTPDLYARLLRATPGSCNAR